MIELMVVIVILGILAAVIAPRIPKFVNKAKEGKTKGNLGNLRSTLNIYYSDNNGKYPLDTLACLTPKYLKDIPVCDLPPHHVPSNQVTPGIIMGNMDLGKWQYNKIETNQIWGSIWIECQHTDSSGAYWSSY